MHRWLAGQALGSAIRAEKLHKRLQSLATRRSAAPSLAPEDLLPGSSPAWLATIEKIRLAATHKDMDEKVSLGRFRRDLYYRLSAFPIRLPPLRQRKGDVLILAARLLGDIANRLKKPGLHLSPDAAEALQAHHWPGNVRELANVLERAAILAEQNVISPRFLDLPQTAKEPASRTVDDMERRLPSGLKPLDRAKALVIRDALDASGGKVSGPGGAAQRLQVPPTTLWSIIKKLGLQTRGGR